MSSLSKFAIATSIVLFTGHSVRAESSSSNKKTPSSWDHSQSKKSAAAQEISSERARPFRITARNLEGNGIGFDQGYTSLDVFLSGTPKDENMLLFTDLRGHIFNNGKWAANGGLGFRYSRNCWAYGLNAFYDYRDAKHRYFQQIGAGFEALGKKWAFRLNGYFPLERKKTYFDGFWKFKGHHALFSKRSELTFAGFDAEVERDLYRKGDFGISALFSGYYLNGAYDRYAAGGLLNVKLNITPYITVQGTGSYDNQFKARGSGEVSLNLPLGKIKKQKACPSNSLAEKLVSPVFRFEIIPTKTHHKTSYFTDPVTGDPVFFIFVDNTRGHSDGTWKNPYGDLDEALGSLLLSRERNPVIWMEATDQPYMVSDTIIPQDLMIMSSGEPLSEAAYAATFYEPDAYKTAVAWERALTGPALRSSVPALTTGMARLAVEGAPSAAFDLVAGVEVTAIVGVDYEGGAALMLRAGDADLRRTVVAGDRLAMRAADVLVRDAIYVADVFEQGGSFDFMGDTNLVVLGSSFVGETAVDALADVNVMSGSSSSATFVNNDFVGDGVALIGLKVEGTERLYLLTVEDNSLQAMTMRGIEIDVPAAEMVIEGNMAAPQLARDLLGRPALGRPARPAVQGPVWGGSALYVGPAVDAAKDYTWIIERNDFEFVNQTSLDRAGVVLDFGNNTQTAMDLMGNYCLTGRTGVPTTDGYFLYADFTDPRLTLGAPPSALNFQGFSSLNSGSDVNGEPDELFTSPSAAVKYTPYPAIQP